MNTNRRLGLLACLGLLGLVAGCGRGPEEARLIGAWRAELRTVDPVFGGPIVTVVTVTYRADGTYSAMAQRQGVRGVVTLSDAGRYTYQDGIFTAWGSLGREKDTIVWLNPDQFRSTCLESDVPGAVGLEFLCTRVK